MGKFFTKKSAYAISVLVFGVVVAFWVLGSGSGNEKGPLLSIASGEKNDPNSPFFASLTLPKENSGSKSVSGNSAEPLSQNITENVVKAYGAKMLEQNPKGTGSNTVQVPAEETLNTILANQLDSASLSIPTYTVRDIRVSTKTPTKEELITYFKSLVDAYVREFKSVKGNYFVSMVDAFSSGRTTEIQTHLDAASRFINVLLSMQVPSGWSAFHVEYLNLWQARLSLGSIIANGSDDPFKAYLAITKFSETEEQENALLVRLKGEMANAGITSTP